MNMKDKETHDLWLDSKKFVIKVKLTLKFFPFIWLILFD